MGIDTAVYAHPTQHILRVTGCGHGSSAAARLLAAPVRGRVVPPQVPSPVDRRRRPDPARRELPARLGLQVADAAAHEEAAGGATPSHLGPNSELLLYLQCGNTVYSTEVKEKRAFPGIFLNSDYYAREK